jgi:hypothetical protein
VRLREAIHVLKHATRFLPEKTYHLLDYTGPTRRQENGTSRVPWCQCSRVVVPSRSTPGHFGPLQPLGALAAPRERPRPAPDEYRLGSAGFGRFSACHTLPARPRRLGSMIILSVFNDAISIVGARSPLILRAAPRSSMPCAHLVDRDIG